MSTADDWRVELTLERRPGPAHLVEAARERGLARDARRALPSEVTITLDGEHLFAYAGSREEAEAARDTLTALAAEHDVRAAATLTRWHPVEERWEDPDVALPEGAADVARETARRDATEDAESEAWGYPEWEVRLDFGRRRDATALADRLTAEGLGVAHRHKEVRVGAPDEDQANALAERLRSEVPDGTTVTAQGSEALAWARLHRYSWLGGLGE